MRQRERYALILGMLTALGPLCTDFYLPALPNITTHLGISTSVTQLTLTTALVGLGVGQLIFGPLSDRLGRKTPLMVSLGLFIVASVWCALAPSIAQLMTARFIQGVAGAGGAVLSRAIARDGYSGPELTRFFAILMAINGVSPIAAPVLGGLQLTITGWQGLFITLAVAGLAMMLIAGVWLQESHPASVRAKQHQAFFSAFGDVLKHRRFMGLCLVQGFMLAGLFAYIGASSYVFQSAWHLSPQQYSWLFATNGVGLIVFSLLTVKLTGRFSEPRVLMGALVLAVIFSAVMLVCGTVASSLSVVLLALFLTVSINSAVCTLAGAMAMETQRKHAGMASAFLGTLMFVMGGISAPLTGIGGTSMASMTVVILLSYVLALVSYLVLGRQKTV